jgi:CO dehydrogenase nickel-insertion accessory protein CooC1
MEVKHEFAGLRVGVFGKGGAGKSTVTVFLARALREIGEAVVVLDADSTNHGLAAALGVEAEPAPLLDYFGGMVFSGGAVTCPVDDPAPLIGGDLDLDELDPRFIGTGADGVRVLVAGKLGALGPGAGCDGPVAKIARDLRITGPAPLPVTVIDYKAGFEDAARGALTTVDLALVVVDPTTAALQAARHLSAMVDQIQGGTPPATRHLESAEQVELANRLFREARVRRVLTVLSRVPNMSTEKYLWRSLKGSGAPVVAVFPEEPAVAERWLRGRLLESQRLSRAARQLATRLRDVARKPLTTA